MTLLTALVMVFSLLTATIASAGTGSVDGEGVEDSVTAQTTERAMARDQVFGCVDATVACEQAQDRTHTQSRTMTREETRTQDQDRRAACSTHEDLRCVPTQGQEQARDQVRDHVQVPVCRDADPELTCVPVGDETRTLAYERAMERLADSLAPNGRYRLAMLQWMWNNVISLRHTLMFL